MKKRLTSIWLVLAALCVVIPVVSFTSGTQMNWMGKIQDGSEPLVSSPVTNQGTSTALDIPYLEEFPDPESIDDWTINDANQDGLTWFYHDNGGGYEFSACWAYRHNEAGITANDWIFSPGLNLKADRVYRLSFWTGTLYGTHKMKATVGQGTNVANHSQVLIEINEAGERKTETVLFTVSNDGVYNLGFYNNTTPTTLSFLYLDNVKVEEEIMNGAPAAVENLTQVPGTNGATTMGLTWKNPSKTHGGSALSSLTAIHIYKDRETTPIVYTGNLATGAQVSWTDPSPTTGAHTYRVAAVNTLGESYSEYVNTFVGIDYPGAPSNVNLSVSGTTASLSWTAPVWGLKGGWFNPSNLSYRIVRQPGNMVLETAHTGTSYTDNTITDRANYCYEITAKNVTGSGGTGVSNHTVIGNTVTLPFSENWENPSTMDIWTIVDVNNPASWYREAGGYGNNGPFTMSYRTKFGTYPNSDDWLFMPPVRLEKNVTYRLSFYWQTNVFTEENFRLTYGKDATPAAQTTTLVDLSGTGTSGSYVQVSKEFTVSTTMNYYIGFQTWNTTTYVLLDDIVLERVCDKDIKAIGVTNLNTAPTVGAEVTSTVSFLNNGTANASGFTVQLLDDENKVLKESKVTRPVAVGVTSSVNLTWTPAQPGKTSVRGRVVFEGDEEPGNNDTAPAYLNVQAETMQAVTIGTETTLNANIPINNGMYTYAQSVYHAEDFNNMTGQINAIAYKMNNGARDLLNKRFKIWMSVSTERSMNAGWIPATEMQLVFDGTIDMYVGSSDLFIPLDTPFEYTGGNVCVLLDSQEEASCTSAYGNQFYVTEYGPAATRRTHNYSDTDPMNPNDLYGFFSWYIPNTMFFFNTEGSGKLSGTVYKADGSTPLAGAVVAIEGIVGTQTTNAQGYYEFPYLPAGTKTVTATLKAYADNTKTVTLTDGGNLTQNFSMTALPEVNLSGKVVGSNDTGVGIAGASVSLKGFEEFIVTSASDGTFTMPKVWGNSTYTLLINARGYENYEEEITIGAGNYDAGDVMLLEETNPPLTVAAVDRQNNALISWEAPVPSVWIQKDKGAFHGTMGSGGESTYAVGHRYTPSDMEALGVNDDLYVTKVRIWPAAIAQYTLAIWAGVDRSETPIYTEELTPPAFGQWYEHTLATPVKIDKTRNLVVGYFVFQQPGVSPVGFDEGPAVTNGDAFFDGTNWTTARQATNGDMNYNWLIHAFCSADPNDRPIELSPGKLAEARNEAIAPKTDVVSEEAAGGYIIKIADRASSPTINYAPKAGQPLGYSVWRLLNGDEKDESKWTALNTEMITELSFQDIAWQPLPNGMYRYAVKSVYPNDVMSTPTFSNVVDKGKYAEVTVSVSSNGANPEGAVVILSNSKGEYKGTVDETGKAIVENVYFGTYKLSIKKAGFMELIEEGIEIADNEEAIGPYQILEDTRPPRNAVAVDYITEARLSWEEPTLTQAGWVYKDTGTSVGSIGQNYGGEMKIGQRYTSAELQPYADEPYYVSKISIYPWTAGVYTISVWRGTEGAEMEAYTQDVIVSDVEQWIEIDLNEPFLIYPDYSHIFGYSITHAMGVYPCGHDAGPAVAGGDIINYSGTWYSFSDMMQGTMNLNWNVHTYITNDSDKGKSILLTKVAKSSYIPAESAMINIDTSVFASNPASTGTPALAPAEDAIGITGYKVWRVKETDRNNEANWTLVTPSPITDINYIDTGWGSQPNGNYYYAIKAKYTGENYSEAVFTNLLEKGTVSLVTATVNTNDGTSAEGAILSLTNASNSYNGIVAADGKAVVAGVKKGTYIIRIEKAGYDAVETSIQVADDQQQAGPYTLNESLLLPLKVSAKSVDDNQAVKVSWIAPGTYIPEEKWIYQDTGEAVSGIGNQTGEFKLSVAHKYTPEELDALQVRQASITKISFFVYDIAQTPSVIESYELRIWTGDVPKPTLAYTQKVNNVKVGEWNEVVLNTPFYISGEEILLVGYECHASSGFPVATDGGPANNGKGNLMYDDNLGWTTLALAASTDRNWVIRAYCEDRNGKSAVLANGEAKAGATGYQVYRLPKGSESNESAWTLLTPSAITALEYTDTSWPSVAQGTYVFAVKAIYKTGTSGAGFSTPIGSDGVGIADVDTIAALIYPNPSDGNFKVEVQEEAELRITDLSGKLVYQSILKAGVNPVSVSLVKGVYTVTIISDGTVSSDKIIIK